MKGFDDHISTLKRKLKKQGHDEQAIANAVLKEVFFLPKWCMLAVYAAMAISFSVWAFNVMFFYAQPMYIYHVRTLLNQERVVDGIGWSYYGGGDYTPWKKALSVQAAPNTGAGDQDQISGTSDAISANLLPQNVVFLDNVDADASASTRFRISTDHETFLKMAHEYRSPENLIITSLIPAFKETLQASASLMSAEEYFSGGRTEYSVEFEEQMKNGIYLVKREERLVVDNTITNNSSANSTKGQNQDEYGDNKKVIFEVVKMLDDKGVPIRKLQSFTRYGITIVEARIPGMAPNSGFVERMKKKQAASAEKSVARESRIQEEEQTLFVIAKGERVAAERQAKAKADQIEATTKAETTKQLALTNASQQMEQAEIDKKTANILLEKSKIDAEATLITAEVEAKARLLKVQADNGLKMKLDAMVIMNRDNADALSKRAVPTTVVYSGNAKGQLGSSNDINTVVTSQMLKNLKALDLDMGVKR